MSETKRERYIRILSQLTDCGADLTAEATTEIVDLLKEVPKWIPVSERLPEVMDGTNGECSDDVLMYVIDENDEYAIISTGFYGYYPNSDLDQGWWSVWAYGCHQLDSDCKVIAWMPLPKPWKGECEMHCNCTDKEIAKSFIEDVEAVKDLLPRTESEK